MRVRGDVAGVCWGHAIICQLFGGGGGRGGETGVLCDCLGNKSQSPGSWVSGCGEIDLTPGICLLGSPPRLQPNGQPKAQCWLRS